jgi:hypothetical protein
MATFQWFASLVLAATILPSLAEETHCPGNVASVPFRFVDRHRIVVAISINHTGPYNFLLDFLEQFDLLIDDAHRLLCLDDSTAMRAEVKGPHLPLVATAEADEVGSMPGLLLVTVRLSGGLRPVRLLRLAGNTNTVSAQSSALQVQVYDYAGLNPAALHQFIAKTQEILASSGVSLEVDACARSAAPCESQTGSSRQIVIRVVADTGKKMKNVRWEKLGMSVAGPDGGTYATVFLKPAEEEASDANLPRTTVLAYAAAHEIGHLLLGDQAHTGQGLMRATWGTGDFEAMAQNRFHFSPEQTQELTDRYGRSHRPEAGADKELAIRH